MDEPGTTEPLTCLVTGATGYIGGRLVPELLAAGHRVRVLSRSPERLRDHPWAGQVEIARADAADAEGVAAACAGVDVVYYLIHALGSGPAFEETDRRTAGVVAGAARAAGVGRLVYLGGLQPQGEELSPHLRSRGEVAEILLGSGVPTVVLRAAVVLGSGSASFEMLRYLTERLPAMVTPSWVRSRIQPIAVRDVLRYLVGCATLPPEVHRCFDIGGPDVMTYEEMMQRYAQVAGLRRRRILRVPVLTPSLSSHWVGLITPVPASIARPLVESLRNTVVCGEHDIARWVPDPPEGLLGFDRAVALALQRVKEATVATRWSSASVPGAPSDPLPTDPDWAGGSLYVDERVRETTASPEALWRVVEGIGGETGWYSFPLAWRVRGWLDRLVGGVGLRRGRRDPENLYVGDALDFWRVEEVEDGRLLRLRAEMRLPGLAWLEFHVEHGRLRQKATFHPRGLLGHLYWWAVAPFHGVVFGGMVRGIARSAEAQTSS
ncbi:SDR family oxidoreductase [Geodermatophilus sp. SYSU D00691]